MDLIVTLISLIIDYMKMFHSDSNLSLFWDKGNLLESTKNFDGSLNTSIDILS